MLSVRAPPGKGLMPGRDLTFQPYQMKQLSGDTLVEDRMVTSAQLWGPSDHGAAVFSGLRFRPKSSSCFW